MEENKELINEDIGQEEQEEKLYTEDEVADLLEQLLPKIEFDNEKLQHFKLDENEFARGVKDASFMAGQYAALTSVGMTPTDAYNIVLNESTGRINIKTAKHQKAADTLATI